MKVLQVINSLATGGAEKLLLDTIPLYCQEGIEMDVLIFWDNEHPFTLTLKKLNCCKVIVLNQSENQRDIYSLSNIIKLRSHLKKYQIVHVHLFPALYFVRLASIGLSVKLIFTEHNTKNRRINNRGYKFLERLCYRGYEKIVCISDEISEIYSIYLNSPARLLVIENGVDLAKIETACAYSKADLILNSTDRDVFILQVSGFRIQKDQDTLIKCLKYLPENFKLLLVGDGERADFLHDLVSSNKLSHRVVFLGLRMDVPAIMKTVDFIVLSSHYEGLSLASIEGLASGKPFIASDVPGLSEVVGGAGILFKKGDAKELAAIITDLSDDTKLYSQVVGLCTNRAKKFDIRTMVLRHLELYYSLSNSTI